jgi:hypothetical protein
MALHAGTPLSRDREAVFAPGVPWHELIVLDRGGNVPGYAVLRTQAFFGRDFIELVVVAVDERRRGIATLLLHHAVEMSSTRRVFTSTNRSNDAMIRLLDKTGWRVSGQLDGVDEGDPELVYYKDSSSSEHVMTFVNPESLT